MTVMPGRSFKGALPVVTAEERALASRLRSHVEVLAKTERNADLDTPAKYIEGHLKSFSIQEIESGGRKVRNIETGTGDIVVGAHYDTVPGSPGADDNASAVAVLIELAAMKVPARFIAFPNEEMPYSYTPESGSWAWAMAARERGEQVRGMFSLEMLGFYSDAPGSQRYPWPLSLIYPDRGDFIAFVGDIGARKLVGRSIGLFRKHCAFPSEGVAAPSFIPGIRASDHWAFRCHGYPALMITDTAYNRNPHYHRASDTPDTLDYERMARVTLGLAAMLREFAHEGRRS